MRFVSGCQAEADTPDGRMPVERGYFGEGATATLDYKDEIEAR